MWKQLSRNLGALGLQGAQALKPRPQIYLPECKVHRWVKPVLQSFAARQKRYGSPLKPNPRCEYAEWNREAELYAFSKRLHEEFDPQLLSRALTLQSYIVQEEKRQKLVGIENPDLQIKDNTELTKQGESFMSEYIQLYIEAALPNFPKEGCTAVKDYLMSLKMLSHISQSLGTKQLILTTEHPNTAILADTFKAVVGALIQSSGEERAGHFVRDFVITNLNRVDVNHLWEIQNPIEMLSEILQKSNKVAEPRLIQAVGKNSILACYRVGIYVDKDMFCAGYGETLEIAHDMAAREGLKIFYGTLDNMAPIDFEIPGLPDSTRQSVKEQLTA
ncbi:mitochondrial ribosomal protein L44 [Arctopsyche grandis]|uniref:mitochondrial ribosomal protein L44 n=1 Tax=Arctopsyche grandis TaxID=121162 RepID=UPI00406D8B52